MEAWQEKQLIEVSLLKKNNIIPNRPLIKHTTIPLSPTH